MANHSYPVEVQTDFLEKITRAKPVQALAEFIWNSLDANASKGHMSAARGLLQALSDPISRAVVGAPVVAEPLPTEEAHAPADGREWLRQSIAESGTGDVETLQGDAEEIRLHAGRSAGSITTRHLTPTCCKITTFPHPRGQS
jgi:hypothetical protein